MFLVNGNQSLCFEPQDDTIDQQVCDNWPYLMQKKLLIGLTFHKGMIYKASQYIHLIYIDIKYFISTAVLNAKKKNSA